MPNLKISELTEGNRALFDDELAANRAGANRKFDVEDLFGHFVNHAQRRCLMFEDFMANSTTTVVNLFSTVSGTGAGMVATNAAVGHPGQARLSTGTTATGRAAVHSSLSSHFFGFGATVLEVCIETGPLSTSAQRYQLLVGFIDTITAVNQADACYFLYDEGGVSTGSTASANWQLVTAENSVRTFTTTSVAFPAQQFTTLRIEANAAGTSVEFFIDGVSVGTHTTNIPNTQGFDTGYGVSIIKSVGTTSSPVDVDYVAYECDLTTPRHDGG